MKCLNNKERMEKWSVKSSDEKGFHKVITPDTCECKEAQIFRLNMKKGDEFLLESKELELHPVLIVGKAKLSQHSELNQEMNRFDSFYIPNDHSVEITALEDCFFYIAGAKYEGVGDVHFRKFDINLPIGDVHQIHGSGAGEREVMFTLTPQDSASKLICGLTWSREGTWTSWPPHQHEKNLEEVYCYFDIPHPKFGLHISYLKSGEIEDIVTHTVQTGTCVQAPCGYHPTVASPGMHNAYFWVLAAFTQSSRRYDLAVLDSNYKDS